MKLPFGLDVFFKKKEILSISTEKPFILKDSVDLDSSKRKQQLRCNIRRQKYEFDTNIKKISYDSIMKSFKIPKDISETPENKVLRLIKTNAFEKNNDISFEQFICVYKEILKNNPEKLI